MRDVAIFIVVTAITSIILLGAIVGILAIISSTVEKILSELRKISRR